MAFIGTNSLTQLLKNSDVIAPFDASKIKNGAYELSLGSQVFQTGVKPRAVKNLTPKEKIYIDPGQFALLLTEEKVKIPKDKIAFISIKARAKFNGLVNVSGFHVDPGFEGQLLFSVYNAGPSTIVLSQGTPYFPVWFAELNETQEYKGTHGGQSEIPDDPIKALSQGELASPNVLSERIDKLDLRKNYTQWLLITLIGILAGITLKLNWDSNKYKEGVESGYKMKVEELAKDSTFQKMQNELDAFKTELDSFKKRNSETKNQSNGAKQ